MHKQPGHGLHLRAGQRPGAVPSKTPSARRIRQRGRSTAKTGLEIDVQSTSQLFTSLADRVAALQRIVLADVPRACSFKTSPSRRTPNRHVRPKHAANGRRSASHRRTGWLSRTAQPTRKSHARQLSNQVRQSVRRRSRPWCTARQKPSATPGKKSLPTRAVKNPGPQDYCGVIHWQGRETHYGGRVLPIWTIFRDQMLTRLDHITDPPISTLQ